VDGRLYAAHVQPGKAFVRLSLPPWVK
jgi:hypothetical protein